MITWSDPTSSEFECEKKYESDPVMGKDSHNFFNYYIKKRFLGNLAVMFVCRMRSILSHSACAEQMHLIFSRENISCPTWMGPLSRINFLCKPVGKRVELQLMTHVYIEMTNTVFCGKLGQRSCRFPRRKKRRRLV